MALVHGSFLGSVAFWGAWSLDVVLVVVLLLLLGLEYHIVSFIFLVYFYFLGCVHPYCH
jgi:hypothetical protein